MSATKKCPECIAEGERSILYSLGGITTCMGWSPYYDEDGIYHNHDPNSHGVNYNCSRGHHFSEAYLTPCPNCDYGHRA